MKSLVMTALILSAISAWSCPKTIEIKNTKQSDAPAGEGGQLLASMTQSTVLQRVNDDKCYYESSPGKGSVKTNLFADIDGQSVSIYLGDTTVAPSKEDLLKTENGISEARYIYKISPATAFAAQTEELLMSYYLLDGLEGTEEFVTRSESTYASSADPVKAVELTHYELILTQDNGSKQIVKK